jgi:hypothetical protein
MIGPNSPEKIADRVIAMRDWPRTYEEIAEIRMREIEAALGNTSTHLPIDESAIYPEVDD